MGDAGYKNLKLLVILYITYIYLLIFINLFPNSERKHNNVYKNIFTVKKLFVELMIKFGSLVIFNKIEHIL